MFAVVGEDKSDVEMINVLIRRIAGNSKLSIKRKGYNGCAEMLVKGAKQLKAYSELGCTKFVICYDSDRDDPQDRYKQIVEKIITPAKIAGTFCALVPVQEIESWILADLPAVTKVIPTWKPTEKFANPESCADPKELLEKLSRTQQQRPLFSHAVHNPRVAEHLDLALVADKCASFHSLYDIVKLGTGNYPIPEVTDDIKAAKRQMLDDLSKV